MTVKMLPGPKGTRLGGSRRDLHKYGPLGFFEYLASFGDFTTCRMGPFRVYLVNDPAGIQELLVTNRDKVRKNGGDRELLSRFLGNGLLSNDGADHQKQRKLVQPAFHMKRIQAYAETMVEHTQAMLERWHDGAILDMDQAMMELTLTIVTKTLFNADISEQEVRQVSQAMEDIQVNFTIISEQSVPLPRWVPTRANRALEHASKQIDQVVQRVIRERRASGEDTGDLLSMLLLSIDDGNGQGMTDQQVRDEVVTLFLAGHETTANTLTWCSYLLSQAPEVRQRLQAEVDEVLQGRPGTLQELQKLPYTEMVIKEHLRMYPPAYALSARVPTENITVLGQTITPRQAAMVSPYAMHHNPRYWPEPERFDPERFSPEQERARHKYAYIPFGAGSRVCIGNVFAMMEAQLLLATMMQHYDFTLDPTQRVEYDPQITLGVKHGLRVRLAQRQPVEQSLEFAKS